MAQYLSTVPALHLDQPTVQPANNSSQRSAPPMVPLITEYQQSLLQMSYRLAGMCTTAVCNALILVPSMSERAGRATAQNGTPQAKIADAAVVSRHHIECLCSRIAILQVSLLVNSTQQQKAGSINPTPEPPPLKLSELAGQVPAPVKRLLRQLGCSTHVALWQAIYFLSDHPQFSCSHIEHHLTELAHTCVTLRNHSRAFLLDGHPTDLPQSQLLELQQHVQLHTLRQARCCSG
jgi:hypothetical protein